MGRASTSQSVDLGFVSRVESYQNTLKNGIRSFHAWRSAYRDGVENNSASLLVVSLSKTLKTGCSIFVTDRVWGQAVYPSWYTSPTEDSQTEQERLTVYLHLPA